jgi:hypothetical protein
MRSGATLKNIRQSRTDMAIFSLIAKLGLDGSSFETGLKRAGSMADKFRSSVGAQLGAALSVAAVVAFTKNMIESADRISDLAEQLNLTTDQIQRLEILAGETGVTFDKFSLTLKKFEEARLKATSGDEDAIKTLKALGLTNKQLYDSQLSTIQGAVKVAEAYKNSGRSAETTAAMTKLYGLELKAAGAALADYETTSNRLLISKDDINALAKANTLLDEQLRIVKALAAPAIAAGITATASAIKSITKPVESFDDKLKRATRRAYATQMLKRMPDEALARIVQQRIAEERQIKIEGPANPPPIGTFKSKMKREISMFTEPAAPGWVNTMVGQIKIMTNETRAVRVNTGRTAQAVE